MSDTNEHLSDNTPEPAPITPEEAQAALAELSVRCESSGIQLLAALSSNAGLSFHHPEFIIPCLGLLGYIICRVEDLEEAL